MILLYNRWVVLGLEVFGTIFWLLSFGLLASWLTTDDSNKYYYVHVEESTSGLMSTLRGAETTAGHSRLTRRQPQEDSDSTLHAGVALARTAVVLSAIEFLLFTITLVVFSLNLHKHRLDGYPSIYRRTVTEPSTVRGIESAMPDHATKEKEVGSTEAANITQDDAKLVAFKLRKDSSSVV